MDEIPKNEGRARGGEARARALSPERRVEIARQGAAATWSGPPGAQVHEAPYPGEIVIGDLVIPCAVLEDGTRVISERGMGRAFGRGRGGYDWRERGGEIPYFLSGKRLKPFIEADPDLVGYQPIYYRDQRSGRVAHGIRAELIPNICDVWIKARDADLLRTDAQRRIARTADTLLRGLAHVGIAALIDEATGYERVRRRGALQEILRAYISDELLPWTSRFPMEFYKEMFRLWGWKWDPIDYRKRGPRGPRYAGKLTRQLIYDQLPPGVLQELEKKNPADKKWQGKAKFFQLLTEDIGNPHLEKLVAVVTALFRISPDRQAFFRHYERAFPRSSVQQELELESEADEAISETI